MKINTKEELRNLLDKIHKEQYEEDVNGLGPGLDDGYTGHDDLSYMFADNKGGKTK